MSADYRQAEANEEMKERTIRALVRADLALAAHYPGQKTFNIEDMKILCYHCGIAYPEIEEEIKCPS